VVIGNNITPLGSVLPAERRLTALTPAGNAMAWRVQSRRERIAPSKPRKSGKITSVEHSVGPCSLASAARCVSGTRLPCTPDKASRLPALRHAV
jgi:hypothetical protein